VSRGHELDHTKDTGPREEEHWNNNYTFSSIPYHKTAIDLSHDKCISLCQIISSPAQYQPRYCRTTALSQCQTGLQRDTYRDKRIVVVNPEDNLWIESSVGDENI
jgi:hypothetical protein